MSRMNPAIPPATSAIGTIANGTAGLIGSCVAYLATIVQDIELYMRLIAMFGGIVVTVLTIVKLCRDLTKKP